MLVKKPGRRLHSQRSGKKKVSAKTFGLCLLFCCLLAGVQSFAQKVTMSLSGGSMEKAIQEIEKKTGLNFVYGKNQLKQAGPVTIAVKNEELDAVLKLLFNNQPLSYSRSGNFIVIRAKEPENVAPKQEKGLTVTGTVTDEKGNPLPSVSVVIPGTPFGAMTDEKGHYVLKSVPENASIVFSYVSFNNVTLPVNNRSVINTSMSQVVKALDEAVIIGYGTTTKRLNTGSVSSITAKEISTQPVSNVLAALPGRIPGVQITQANGLPGSAAVVQIRGQGSMNNGNLPLYIIDGVPFTNYSGGQPVSDNMNAWGTSGANGGISPFSMINPDDIERMDILKDADATAIYGARGANGVILITTKKGKTGKTRVNANVYTGSGKVGRFIPMMNTQQYLELRKEAFANDGLTPTTASAPELTQWDQNANTDWQKLLIGGTARSTDAQASVSGGDSKTHYLLSGGYHKETTVYPGNFNDMRLTGRLTADHTSSNNKFYISTTVNYSNDNSVLPTNDLTQYYNLPPNMPLYDKDGNLAWVTGFNNPLALLNRKIYNTTSNFMASANLRYTIIKNLNFKLNAGYSTTGLDQNARNPASSYNPVNNPTSSAIFTTNKTQNYIVEPTLDYTYDWGKSTLNAMVGGTLQRSLSNGNYLNGTNYSSEALLGTLAGAGLVTVSSNNYFDYKYASAYGRINYGWDRKYLLNLTFRRDASSRFGPDNAIANFGALGAAWVFTQENFFTDHLTWLDYGKVRASYGTTGNDQITNYTYLPLLSSAGTYQNQLALYRGALPNPGVKWESTKKLEFGLELGMLKDNIKFTGDYYQNRSSDQLLSASLATQSGYNSYVVNMPALVQNSGVELELNTLNLKRYNFGWSTSFNITFPKNKLVSFPGIENSFYASSYLVGQPIDVARKYVYTGYDPKTGIPQYQDLNKDGVIDYNNDRKVINAGTPFFGGISNTFSYRQWDFSFFFQYNHRNGATNNINTPLGNSRNNQNVSVIDRWRKADDVAAFPAATSTSGKPIYNGYTQYSSSTALWGDASYLKLRSANISYSFPQAWLKAMKFSNFKVYAEAQNLFTWAKNKYIYDPETSVSGGAPGLGTGAIAMPPLRTIVFGVNCSF
ncbi:SusC/RagA family TonB-linked outer membrane protein [Chitinophaga sp. Cy-1792]|uniref:SusC/RagA family TonB-linked outer membrane protein n=1 Tax=Chitinophaga sp. Cy-1792 TaxID=2608339 RepID=UPI0014211846|nr:SusC/RagA family TonB-linked outer membrane protein [Chitinophaga sp. Cy-1792]NIG57557.1 SusC/RagA family TonB-linked outer membrane protein [Chitinophaga sp. Cy-1792]